MEQKREYVARLCRKQIEKLVEQQFDDIHQSAFAQTPDILLADYSVQLTEKIENDYRTFLKEMWEQVKGDDTREFEVIMNKSYTRLSIDSVYRQQLRPALREAQQITIWEQLTNTNYKDEERFRELLKGYVVALLRNMMYDFLEDIEP